MGFHAESWEIMITHEIRRRMVANHRIGIPSNISQTTANDHPGFKVIIYWDQPEYDPICGRTILCGSYLILSHLLIKYLNRESYGWILYDNVLSNRLIHGSINLLDIPPCLWPSMEGKFAPFF